MDAKWFAEEVILNEERTTDEEKRKIIEGNNYLYRLPSVWSLNYEMIIDLSKGLWGLEWSLNLAH